MASLLISYYQLQMNGNLSFVDSFKKTMNLLPSQKVIKGISSADVNYYLRWLKSYLFDLNIEVDYVRRRVKKVDKNTSRHFNGDSVNKLMNGRIGQYILFGKAKWNNDAHRKQIKRLRAAGNERMRFKIYGIIANGTKQSDHAVGVFIRVDDDHVLYDNSMRNISLKLTADSLANKMSDVSCCYIFDLKYL